MWKSTSRQPLQTSKHVAPQMMWNGNGARSWKCVTSCFSHTRVRRETMQFGAGNKMWWFTSVANQRSLNRAEKMNETCRSPKAVIKSDWSCRLCFSEWQKDELPVPSPDFIIEDKQKKPRLCHWSDVGLMLLSIHHGQLWTKNQSILCCFLEIDDKIVCGHLQWKTVWKNDTGADILVSYWSHLQSDWFCVMLTCPAEIHRLWHTQEWIPLCHILLTQACFVNSNHTITRILLLLKDWAEIQARHKSASAQSLCGKVCSEGVLLWKL